MITLEFEGCIYFTWSPEYDAGKAAAVAAPFAEDDHFLLCDVPLRADGAPALHQVNCVLCLYVGVCVCLALPLHCTLLAAICYRVPWRFAIRARFFSLLLHYVLIALSSLLTHSL